MNKKVSYHPSVLENSIRQSIATCLYMPLSFLTQSIMKYMSVSLSIDHRCRRYPVYVDASHIDSYMSHIYTRTSKTHPLSFVFPTCFSLSLMFLFERYGYGRANWQAFVFVIRGFVQHLITNVFFLNLVVAPSTQHPGGGFLLHRPGRVMHSGHRRQHVRLQFRFRFRKCIWNSHGLVFDFLYRCRDVFFSFIHSQQELMSLPLLVCPNECYCPS